MAARSTEPILTLRKPLERAIRDGHPWVYRDAVSGVAEVGTVATLADARGDFVARGLAEQGPIALRVFSIRDEALAAPLLAARVQRASELRDRIIPPSTSAYRLLHGEGDRLPGFVCDVYGAWAVLKTDGEAAAAWRGVVQDVLAPVLKVRGVHSLLVREGGRSRDADGPISTLAFGEEPPETLSVVEHGMTLCVDLARGQKTGLFLDQRESRRRVRELAPGLRVLNLYGYTGGFSVAAGLGGARRVETVDVAPAAIAAARATWAANGLASEEHDTVVADVPEHLALRARERARYQLVIADPPSFAPREDRVPVALKSYRALHTACMALIPAGGYYLSASCSSHVNRAAFADTVLEAARRSGRALQVLDAWGAPADHPRLLAFPEGDYLKAMLFRVE